MYWPKATYSCHLLWGTTLGQAKPTGQGGCPSLPLPPLECGQWLTDTRVHVPKTSLGIRLKQVPSQNAPSHLAFYFLAFSSSFPSSWEHCPAESLEQESASKALLLVNLTYDGDCISSSKLVPPPSCLCFYEIGYVKFHVFSFWEGFFLKKHSL